MENEQSKSTNVIITGIKLPFWSMVFVMVKWAIAALPAFIILTIVWAIFTGLLAGFFS